jgi:RNA polymerase sigma-70 factor, ECF subfamily
MPPMWVSVFAAVRGGRSARKGPAAPSPAQLAGCRRGDRAALEAVLGAHAPRLERLLARLVGPGADAEDLLQETFIEAITAFPRFRGDASVSTWLHRIAVHVAHRHLRRPQRRRTVSLEVVPGNERPDPAASPERGVELRRQLERLYGHLDRLSANKRIAFLLHVVDDRPIAEVAALMGATEAATKSRVFWARRALLARVARDPGLADLVAPEEGA